MKKLTALLSIRSSLTFLAVAGTFAVGTSTLAAQTTIYSDSFARTGDLLNSAPDIRPGSETWIAAATGRATNGSELNFTLDRGNAFLPFTPGVGVYELSVTVQTVAASSSNDWHAIGFMQPNPSIGGGGVGNFAFSGTQGGYAWALLRNSGATVTFAGLGGSENQGGDPAGTYAGGVPHTIMIRLDTTDTQWSYQAFLNGNPIAPAYTYPLGLNPNIGAVGLSTAGGTTMVYTFDDFDLTLIPEPSTYAAIFGGLALIGLLIRRRLRS